MMEGVDHPCWKQMRQDNWETRDTVEGVDHSHWQRMKQDKQGTKYGGNKGPESRDMGRWVKIKHGTLENKMP